MSGKTVQDALSMLFKFGSNENMKKLQAGQFYMKNLRYYVDLEKSTSDDDVGDMYDGLMMMQDVRLSMFTIDTNEFICQFSTPSISMDLGYLNCPVFCMFVFDYRNHVSETLNGDMLTVEYRFTDEQIKKLPNFGDSALIIKNGDEFLKRVKKALLAHNIGFSRDSVSYYGFNNIEHIKQIQNDNSRIAFWKRQKYDYQQEHRFVLHTEVDDFLSIDIGDISDITQLMKTEELLNTYLKVDYIVSEKE